MYNQREKKMGEEGLGFAERWTSVLVAKQCRICHEEEEESSGSMESPCACTGSLKFAHRKCVQTWCDEKGNNSCEICLQKFEPDYIAQPKRALTDIPVTIRGSLEVPRLNQVLLRSISTLTDDEDESNFAECSPISKRGSRWIRWMILILALFVFARNVGGMFVGADEQYALDLATLCVLRAGCLVLLMCMLLRIMAVVPNLWRHEEDADTTQMEGDEAV